MSYRDMFGTGKIIFGSRDEAMLQFTGSMKWFEDGKGWKSTQGGFSAVKQITTDENDMGAFFVRKMAGAAALTFHLQKLIPVVFQRSDVHWGCGHFKPVLMTSILGNLALAGFYVSHLEDFKISGAEEMGFGIAAALIVEAVVLMGFVLTTTLDKSPTIKATKLPDGKGPNSIVSKILSRTFCCVTGVIALIAARDFFFTGHELPFPPYDDIYLEWTGAFIHSPPSNSVEAEEHGMEAPLHIGNKFASRLLALYLLIVSFQKFTSAFLVRVGKDNSGEKKCKMFWQTQALGNAFLLFTMRVFTAAAMSASLDFRWHVMSLGYETFVLAIYAFM
eukprot:CAMPEP_0197243836 /NCGR_PEP_ID=MMETSP1429-20130617/9142_1 /TAXON_ID=49237 /ORGANISM="Chaetoceros  sp., Strain UNC1202" /LENGTH=332 /DNA_ID=CAMNT_0042704105 /DNA_START=24 /DNA_END=1022 /DNA_ORIENTATION=+